MKKNNYENELIKLMNYQKKGEILFIIQIILNCLLGVSMLQISQIFIDVLPELACCCFLTISITTLFTFIQANQLKKGHMEINRISKKQHSYIKNINNNLSIELLNINSLEKNINNELEKKLKIEQPVKKEITNEPKDSIEENIVKTTLDEEGIIYTKDQVIKELEDLKLKFLSDFDEDLVFTKVLK